jgi:hypothetical protein
MNEENAKCLYCEKDSNEVPLIVLTCQGEHLWICPQHMPLLIHNPSQLVGKLPGAENLASGDLNE